MAAALWGGHRAPFTLLGGYLGAGKTTIVNHLVRQPVGRRLVVLVNDVGAVNVDAALIAAHDGVTMSLTNGCVCCSIADDLGQTLEQVRALPEPPDHVVLELSGVAEPDRVSAWANTAGFRLDGVVVAVDAELIGSQLDRHEVGDTVAAQLGAADLIVLTKTDLVADGGDAARRRIAEHSTAPVVVAVDGELDAEVMFGIDRPTASTAATAMPVPAVPGDGATNAGHRVSVRDLGDVTAAELERIIEDLPADVLRAKGLIRCRETDHPFEVNVVGRRRRVRPRPDLDQAVAGTELVVIEH